MGDNVVTKTLTVEDFVTEYWPLNHTCNYVWEPKQVLQPELANMEGYKAYVLYGEYASVHAVVIAKDYDEAVVTAADNNMLDDYALTAKELQDYTQDDGRGGVEYPGVDMLGGNSLYGYDISGLRFLEVNIKELLVQQ